jgi:subtilisin-like proprotein convertase family protein
MTNTVFDSQATATIGTGKGPFTGSFSPVGSLGVLNGKDIRGTWKLWVEDRGGVNRGSLDNWSLVMTRKVGTTATTAQADAMAQAYQASQRKNAGGIA